MDTKYYIIMGLFLLGCLVSIRFGWTLATDYWDKKLTKEMREEAAEYFRKMFFEDFVKKFDEKVEARAVEIAVQMVENYEKEKKHEGSDSN